MHEKLYDSKTKDVAWFVSHCDTWGQREVYVERMRKIVNVDIFGHCGNLKCGIAESKMAAERTECFQMLTKRYKFYLSFENAFCRDYISEKFFKLFTEVDIIPVVRGGLEYQKYLPSGMFVDAADFKSPEALAKYLVRLGKNKGEYVKMLRTKNSWTSCHFNENEACSVCRYLHTAGNKIHFYENIVEILHGNCWPASDL